MRKALLLISAASTLTAFASGDVWLWRNGKYVKEAMVDSITFEHPLGDAICKAPTVDRVYSQESIIDRRKDITGDTIHFGDGCIVLKGKNMGRIEKVYIRGREVFDSQWGDYTLYQLGPDGRLQPVEVPIKTDTTLILYVPGQMGLAWTGKAEVYLEECSEKLTLEGVEFADVDITPSVNMVYNEFVAGGELLKVKGPFLGDAKNLEFKFTDGDGKTAIVSGDNIEGWGDLYSDVSVRMPEDLGTNVTFSVRNIVNNLETKCPIILRDCRNLLVDFDTNIEKNNQLGAIKKDKDGNYSMVNGPAWVSDVPKNFSLKSTNNFGIFQNSEKWDGISFAPEADGKEYDDVQTVFGPFKDLIMKDPASAENYVVKFEINIDEPTKFMTLAMGFISANQQEIEYVRKYCAAFQASEIFFDKSNPEDWRYISSNNFSTNGEWMTVTVPMSEFMWDFWKGNYLASAKEFSEGDFQDELSAQFLGDPKNHEDYVTHFSNKMTNDDDLYEYFGGFAISFNPYDGPKNDDITEAHFAIDNIRIVPNDGNGAIYPKLKFGRPEQHFHLAPRIK